MPIVLSNLNASYTAYNAAATLVIGLTITLKANAKFFTILTPACNANNDAPNLATSLPLTPKVSPNILKAPEMTGIATLATLPITSAISLNVEIIWYFYSEVWAFKISALIRTRY